jgi:hypothetical protein
MADDVEALVTKLNKRIKDGPRKKKPGEISASDETWWDKFWNFHKGDDTHKIEKDLKDKANDPANSEVPPESKRLTKILHTMKDSEIEKVITRHGFRSKKNDPDLDVGEETLRRAIRREYKNRGYNVTF